jgi:hypothetical protein
MYTFNAMLAGVNEELTINEEMTIDIPAGVVTFPCQKIPFNKDTTCGQQN